MTLYDLKVGDEVILENYPRRAVEKIERVTPTKIILSNDRKFYKRNGAKVNAIKYDNSKIRVVVPELVAEIKEKEKMKMLVGKLQEINWAYFPQEVLVKVCYILEGYKAAQQKEYP